MRGETHKTIRRKNENLILRRSAKQEIIVHKYAARRYKTIWTKNKREHSIFVLVSLRGWDFWPLQSSIIVGPASAIHFIEKPEIMQVF